MGLLEKQVKYFEVKFDRDKIGEGIGIAYVLDPDAELPEFLPDGYVKCWTAPVLLILDRLEGGYADYQPNDMGVRMCSPRLRGVLDRYASKDDVFQWLDASIMALSKRERKPYYILHFPGPPDVLDRARTRYGPGGDSVVEPALASERAKTHHVFCYPDAGDFRLFISEDAKRAITAEDLTGMTFTPLRTDDELA